MGLYGSPAPTMADLPRSGFNGPECVYRQCFWFCRRRRRGTRGEEPLELSVGILPDAAGERGNSPEEEALLADSAGLTLYVVMDALTPAERVSFVLHDVLEIAFDAIAAVLGRSTARSSSPRRRHRNGLRQAVTCGCRPGDVGPCSRDPRRG